MNTRTRGLILAALFAALTAVGSFIRIPLGAMAFTMQFFFTAMAGLLLGPTWGALSQIVYIVLGLVGLPIFVAGGGIGYVFQPSFGFLLGLPLSAWVVGKLAGKEGRFGRVFAACVAGLCVLYFVGLPYMYGIFNLYLGKQMSPLAVVQAGMLIYLPGDFLKILVVALLARPTVVALAHYR